MHFKKTAAFAAALCMLFAAAPIAPFQNAAETVSLCAEAAESSADLYDFLKNNTSDPASAAIVGNGETLTMSGRVYGAGIRFTSQWNRESSIDLNVEALTSLKFTAGHVDGASGDAATMNIYLDNELYTSVELSGTSELKAVTLPVAGVKTARIVCSKTSNRDGVYAITGIRTDSLNTEDAYALPVYTNSLSLTKRAYNLVNCSRYPDDDAADAKPIVMNGRTFESGIAANLNWNSGASFGINVEHMETLLVTVGHIDGTGSGSESSALHIYLDGNAFKTVDLTERMGLQTIEIPVKNKFSTAVFIFDSTPNSTVSYGVGDIKSLTMDAPADTAPVYKTGKDIVNAAFDGKHTTVYPIVKGKYEEDELLRMNGRAFTSGIVLESSWNYDSAVGINTEHADELTFTVGHLDGSGNDAATLHVYLDGVQYKLFKDADGKSTGDIPLTYTMPLKTITLPVKDVQSVRIVVDRTANDKSGYGIADIRTESAADTTGYTDPVYANGKDIIVNAFNPINVQNYPIESENIFEDPTLLTMNGRSYENALTLTSNWNYSSSVGIDTANIDKLQFTVGHQDGTNYESSKLHIMLDGKEADSSPIVLTPEMPLKTVVLDVENVQSVHLIAEKTPNTVCTYGIGGFITQSGSKVVKDSPAFTAPAYKDGSDVIKNVFTIKDAERIFVETSAYEEPQTFPVSGVSKTEAVKLTPSWNTIAAFGINTENVDQITCKIGAMDENTKEQSTLNIYLDGMLYEPYKDLALTSDMALTDLTIPTKGVQSVVFSASKTGNNKLNLAVTDFGFVVAAAEQPTTPTEATTETTASTSNTTTTTTTTQATTTESTTQATTTESTTQATTTETTTQATTTETTTQATTTEATTTTTAATTTATTEATVSTEKPEGWFASLADIREMVKKDYELKHPGVKVTVSANIIQLPDMTYAFKVLDENGETLEQYQIDPKSGMGITTWSNEIIDLPKTGVTSPSTLLILLSAMLSVLGGAALMLKNGIFRKKED